MNKFSKYFSLLFIFCYSNIAFCAGLDRVNTLMDNVQGVLTGVSLVSVTVAVLWAGYKILFGGQTFREVAPILIGGIAIGAASEIAGLFISK
ncbi:TrbC/VirB2 family protein [Orbus sturtevantii]|uniref:TrbC/VirB2 family protein n=1 Tax=Orbus sturtevantii TaxID=3074109 RepID=UPI00370D3764